MKLKISSQDYYFADKNVLSGKNILVGDGIIIFFSKLHRLIKSSIFGGWASKVPAMQLIVIKLRK